MKAIVTSSLVVFAAMFAATASADDPVVTVPNPSGELKGAAENFTQDMVLEAGSVVLTFAGAASGNVTTGATNLVSCSGDVPNCDVAGQTLAFVTVPVDEVENVIAAAGGVPSGAIVAASAFAERVGAEGIRIANDKATEAGQAAEVLGVPQAVAGAAGTVVTAVQDNVCDYEAFAATQNASDCGAATVVATVAAGVEQVKDSLIASIEGVDTEPTCLAFKAFVTIVSSTAGNAIQCTLAPEGSDVTALIPDEIPPA